MLGGIYTGEQTDSPDKSGFDRRRFGRRLEDYRKKWPLSRLKSQRKCNALRLDTGGHL